MFDQLNEDEISDLKEQFSLSNSTNNTPLYLKTYRRLRELIVRGYYKCGDKLLSEAELAYLMGVGRTTLRTALVLLSEDGYIQTFQGKGTYIVYDSLNVFSEFPDKYLLPFERLSSFYGNKKIFSINVEQFASDYDPFLDEVLDAGGRPIHVFMRNYAVNGNVAVLTNVYYPSTHFANIDFKDFDKTEKLLTEFFKAKVKYVESSILPAIDSSSRKLNKFEDNSANFILVSSIWYDEHNNPLVFTKDHYNGNYIGFKARFLK